MTSLKISAMASAHRAVERFVHGDDAAERRLLVRGECLVPCFAQACALADTARISMFEDGQRRRVLAELADERGRGGEVENVVVGKFLPVQLFEVVVELAVERRRLVRIFAVAQRLRQRRENIERRWQAGGRRRLEFFLQMRGNGAVISRGAGKNFRRQFAAQFQRCVAAPGNLFRNLRVIKRVHHHRHAVMIFRRAAQHRRPADINVLNRIVQAHVRLGDGLLERIKIHHDEINRLNAMCADGGFVRLVAANEQQAAVDFRMQGFDAAIEHFGKAGVFADVFHCRARPRAASGRCRRWKESRFRLWPESVRTEPGPSCPKLKSVLVGFLSWPDKIPHDHRRRQRQITDLSARAFE